MSSTLLPFLYQTRTLQRVWRVSPSLTFLRRAHSNRGGRSDGEDYTSGSIPFDWGSGGPPEDLPPRHGWRGSDMDHESMQSGKGLTLSPNEAHVFKRIFEEISQGKMGAPTKARSGTHSRNFRPTQSAPPRTLVEHERMAEFRDKYLQRFPESLRNTVNNALGLFELVPNEEAMEKMSEEEKELWEQRKKHNEIRDIERRRVEALMQECRTDFALWDVMETEVFCLPEKLGILPKKPTKRRRKTKKEPRELPEEEAVETAETYAMDVYGPLYSHYINYAVKLFDTSFTRPSAFAFQVLPRLKSLGLTSYVLGASTPLYTTLASIHWERFGDATSALDTIQEISATGLHADEEVNALLKRMRRHIEGCSKGFQGSFVSAMTNATPFDGNLMSRLVELEKSTRRSIWSPRAGSRL